MPRDERLFGDVVSPSISMGNRQRTSVGVTVLLETILVGAVITIPLMATDVLPSAPDMMGAFVAAVSPPPPPPPPPRGKSSTTTRESQPVEAVNRDLAPTVAPDEVTPEAGPPNTCLECGGDTGGVPDGHEFGVPFGNGVGPPPPPPPVIKQPPPEVVHVGGNVLAPRKIRDVKPVYPVIAQRSRVEGLVILEATIDTAGRVINVRVLQSKALLDQAAIDAVRQWEFTPTLLNGVPVSVIMNVTVNFRLQ
jgi:protein TonB